MKNEMEIVTLCIYCMGEVDADDKFCKHCGKKFDSADNQNDHTFNKGYKKGYNDAKRDMINRLLTKEI